MPDSYSSNLRLTLQAAGGNDSTWGDFSNVNLRLLEDAISGLTSIATTGGDTTLTTNNGAASYGTAQDQARYAILKITGTLTTNSNIVIPAITKQYIVWNATSGAHTVTVKLAASTGIAVTQGQTALLFTDGSEVYNSTAALNANLSAIGTLAVTDGNVIVGDGATWVAESGATARTSLGAATESEVMKVGVHSLWIPASAMTPRTTNGAAAGTAETATNKIMLSTLDFDKDTVEYAQFAFKAPKSWDHGNFTAVFVWSHAATTTNFGVVWGIQGLAVSDGDALDTAFSAGDGATDTGGTTNTLYHSPESASFAISNTPAQSDYVVMQVYRSASAGADTMAIDARLHGVLLKYTLNAATDA